MSNRNGISGGVIFQYGHAKTRTLMSEPIKKFWCAGVFDDWWRD